MEDKKTAENTENTEKTDNRTDRFDLEKMMKEAEIERRQRKAQKKAEQIARKEKKARLAEEKKARLAEEKKAKETEKARLAEEKKAKETEKDKIILEARNFEEYYDAQKLENDKYLHEIFEGNDREYLKNLVRQCKEKKYPASPLLNEFLFLSVLNRRQHINLVFLQKDNPASPDIPKIERRILDYQEKINKIGDTLEKYREEKKKEIDIAALHDTVLKEAESYIRQHIGEFSFKCSSCGEMVQTDGLPHWAFKRGVDEEGNPIYFIWNQELWLLVEQKLISVAYMAFALHTSIQGIKWTYEERNKERGLQFPKWIDIKKEEEVLKGLQQMWKEYEMFQQQGRIEKLGSA